MFCALLLLAEIADEFMRWVYAGGKKLKGLENRCRREVAMYFKGEYL